MVALVGGCSGRDVDKFQAFGLVKAPTLKVNAPVLEVAYAAYECRVAARYPSGDHECFFGEIVAVHHRPRSNGPDQLAHWQDAHPLLYLGDDSYTRVSPLEPVRMERPVVVAQALGGLVL